MKTFSPYHLKQPEVGFNPPPMLFACDKDSPINYQTLKQVSRLRYKNYMEEKMGKVRLYDVLYEDFNTCLSEYERRAALYTYIIGQINYTKH